MANVSEEYDDLYAEFDFAQVDWESVPGLETVRLPLPEARNNDSSSDFDIEDDFANQPVGFFAEMARLESSHVGEKGSRTVHRSKRTPTKTSPKSKPASDTPSASLKSRHTNEGPSQASSTQTRLQSVRELVMKVFEDFDDEMTCPICCDILTATHVANPCGHSACGACFTKWIESKPRAAVCPNCRAPLNRGTPIIPNYVMDNMVEKHLQTLADLGCDDWKPAGSKRKERDDKIVAWKEKKSLLEPVTHGTKRRAVTVPAEEVAYIDVGSSDADFIVEDTSEVEEEEGGEYGEIQYGEREYEDEGEVLEALGVREVVHRVAARARIPVAYPQRHRQPATRARRRF